MNTKKLMQRALRRTLAKDRRNTTTITLHYTTGRVVGDLNDTDTWSGTPVAHTAEIKGLIHFISPATIANRGFIELRVGDIILDLDPQVTFLGMDDLVFEIDGRTYQQKQAGKEVERYYDLVMGGTNIFRTLVLSPGDPAAEPALATGSVFYLDGVHPAVEMLTFDFATRRFTPSAGAAGIVDVFGLDADWLFQLKINGHRALAVDREGVVRVSCLDTTHASELASAPRIEFFVGASRVAALSQGGKLAIVAFTETETDPEQAQGFALTAGGGDWLATLSSVGLEAPDIADGLA